MRLRQRPDVEYAQAAYRVHTEMVPNDQTKDGSSKDVSENDLGGVAARIRVILGR
jgi:hypothetical protein